MPPLAAVISISQLIIIIVVVKRSMPLYQEPWTQLNQGQPKERKGCPAWLQEIVCK